MTVRGCGGRDYSDMESVQSALEGLGMVKRARAAGVEVREVS